MSNVDKLDKHLIFNIYNLILNSKTEEALRLLDEIDISSQAPEFKGHLFSWKAQCLLDLKHYEASIRCFNEAIREAKKNNQMEVVTDLRTHRDHASALAAAMVLPKSSDAQSPISKALEVALDDPKAALDALKAHQNRVTFDENPKEYILCLLAQSRLSSDPQPLLDEALTLANKADDPNLIGAVKRTMDHLGVRIPTKTF